MSFPVILLYILVIGEGIIIAWLASYLDGIHKRIDGVVRDTNKGFSAVQEDMRTQNEITHRTIGVVEQMNQNYFGLKEDIANVDKSQRESRTYYMNYVSRRDNNGN